ncbi:inositol polyphosphate 5-phosphatase [Podila horticola]|nr:inositol polyphosphate 5-phosphatase [Podila horticola]
MQSEVYLSTPDQPTRTIALRQTSNRAEQHGKVLYFSMHDQPAAIGQPKCEVQLEPASQFLSARYRKLHVRGVYGCLGLMHHANGKFTQPHHTFIAFVTGCVKVGDIRMGESVYKIVAVRFFSLTGNTPDEDMIPVPYVESLNTFDNDKGPTMMPHPCKDLEKVLCNGAFFFSPQFDLTRSIQTRSLNAGEMDKDTVLDRDESFLWNHFMLKEMLLFRSHLEEQDRDQMDAGGLLVHVIQGYVGCQSFRTANTQGQISVISRLSSRRAGTRYNTRGIDDNGNVANFVETETILSNPEWCFAYTQIRGSVPVFWEQQGLQLASHKIQLSRGPEATKPAVRRHFEELVNKYEDVHIIDLLGTKDQGEMTLSQEYKNQVQSIGPPLLDHLHMTRFDYHSQVKGGNYDQVQSLLQHVKRDSEKYGYFYHDLVSNTIIQTQRGVFRTNCLDCLDRTNVIQSNLSKEAIEYLLLNLQDQRFANLMLMHSEIWADNGDMLSKVYTGTGALKSEVTRSGKMSFASMLGDATKSINRFYINNFQDKDRQETIDFLLGKMANQTPVAIYDPVHDSIASEMSARLSEYSQKVQIDVFVGTYNLNGKAPSGESLASWLCFDKDIPEPDMYVIGFQEIVKLTPKQIMATDENKRIVWEQEVERTINRRGGSRYIQLRSGQLVGAALMIYAKEQNAPHIRNLEISIKKTGMGGMAGNKGAVAVRMDYYETSLCLVTSHLASGQDNLTERNSDFHTIDGGIAFARGRSISTHDIILWCGDFNYRVDMENDQIRALVSQQNYFEIYRCDQLRRSIDYGEAFQGYKEGIIAFAPSYRYDIGTDNYDTSEKYRAPAWTDRILYKGDGIYQTSYERAELRASDHRPVMAMFVLELTVLDSEAKDKMEQTLYRKSSSRSLPGSITRSRNGPSSLGPNRDKRQNGHGIDYGQMQHAVAQKPSSDAHQWWNDPLEDGIKRVPSKNTNPFVGERTEGVTDRLARSTTMPVRRPTPPPPSNKKPVDLLGGSKATGRHVPDVKSSPSLNIKRTAPPPPPGRKFTPLPASTSIMPKDGSAARRPAPPPPRRASKGADTDDDSNDSDDEDDFVDANSSVASKDQTTSGDHGQAQETLLKPSALKKDPVSVPGPGPKSAPAPPVSRGTKPDTSSALASSLASVAANKNKVLLPGDIKKPVALVPSSSVGSLGLTPGGVRQFNSFQKGPVEPSKPIKDDEEVVPPSVSALKKSFGTPSVVKDEEETSSSSELKKSYGVSKVDSDDSSPAPAPSVAALKKSYGTKTSSDENPIAAEIFERKKSYGVAKSTTKEDDSEPVLSVSKLKKSYGTGASPKDSEVAPTVSELKKSYGFTLVSGSAKDPEPEAPTVAALTKSFGTKGIITPQPVSSPSGPSVGGSSILAPVHGAKVKMAGLGSVQSGLVLKGSSLSGGSNKVGIAHHDHKEVSSGDKINVKSKDPQDTEVEDVMPASGSVKNAIAALKGTPTGGAGEQAKEKDPEEDKVDAFAYWKSK